MKTQIHFLNTGQSDCIILESDGHFAMIDGAEDTEYPANMPYLNTKGYEDEVIAYLLEHCAGADGKVTLDFILGTHSHSDHIGGFDTIILHPDIIIKKAYLKYYSDDNVNEYERKKWDNQTVYNQMYNALVTRNVPIISDFDREKIRLGEFEIEFFNGSFVEANGVKYGENVNSVVTKVVAYDKVALLMGDMNYKKGMEQEIGREVKKVDILKVGHHGYMYSTSFSLIHNTMPKIAVITNFRKCVTLGVKFKLKAIARAKTYYTANSNGVIAEFCKNQAIKIKENIM